MTRVRAGPVRVLAGAAAVAAVMLATPGAALAVTAPGTAPPRVAPAHRLVLGASRVDVLLDGRLVSRLTHPPGVVEIGWLAGRVPAGWVSVTGAGTVRLLAELSVGRGAALEVGPRTGRLELAGGPDPRASSGISVQGGSLQLLGTTVASVDPGTGRPVPPGAAGRPWLSAGSGGRVDMRDSRVTDLGDATTGARSAGLFLGPGATGSVLRSTFTGNGTGLVLSGTQTVSLSGVRVTGSALDGLLLRGDAGTALASVLSTGNGRDGVAIVGGDGRRISGLRTEHNQRFGIRASGLTDLALTSPRSVGDGRAALVLRRCTSCAVDDPGVQGGRIGLQIADDSGPVRITGGSVQGAAFGVQMAPTADRVTLTGLAVTSASYVGVGLCGRQPTLTGATVTSANIGVEICSRAARAAVDHTGIRAARTGIWVFGPVATGTRLTHSTVVGGRDSGIDIGGSGVAVTDVRVDQAHVGVRVYGQAARTVLDQIAVTGGRDGIVATDGTRELTVTGPTVTGVSGTGLRLASSALTVRAGTVRDAAVGANLPGAGRLSGLRISGVARGVWVGERGRITAEGIDVLAARTGVQVDGGGSMALASSRVRAARALVGQVDQRGPNTVSLPPFPWFGLAALTAVLLAFALEVLHHVRASRSSPPRQPDPLLNTT